MLEIEIENRHGWAQKLPIWPIDNKWPRAFYKKSLTGYHFYAQGFMFIVAHNPCDVPVLLRHYPNLGGQLVAFNIDRSFGRAIDGLIEVDLTQVDRKPLQRNMGVAGALNFLAYHGSEYSKDGVGVADSELGQSTCSRSLMADESL